MLQSFSKQKDPEEITGSRYQGGWIGYDRNQRTSSMGRTCQKTQGY